MAWHIYPMTSLIRPPMLPLDGIARSVLDPQAIRRRLKYEKREVEMAIGVVVLTAGASVYVFDAFDGKADLQETVCLGANLDVTRYVMPVERWEAGRAGIEQLDDVTIVDCRQAVTGP